MHIEGEALLLRIFVGESDKHGHLALYESGGKDKLKALLLEKAALDARCVKQEALWLKLAEELEGLESA